MRYVHVELAGFVRLFRDRPDLFLGEAACQIADFLQVLR